jgi:hypothetical protein
MSQTELDVAVAAATGEDRRRIARLGFSELRPMRLEEQTDEDRLPLVVDWDQLDLERYLTLCG